MKKEYILFIDSGIGGLSTLATAMKLLPTNYLYFADNLHAPFGSHSKKDIFSFIKNIITNLSKNYNFKIVVLACNTATTSCISKLRKEFKNLTFVGTEPAIKKAKDLGFYKVLSLTTPSTKKQLKYKNLIKQSNIKIKTLSISNLANNIENFYIEHNFLNKINILKNLYYIKSKSINYQCIILGCTHYVFISNIITKITSKQTLDGNIGVAHHLKSISNKNGYNYKKKPHVIIKLSDTTNFAIQKYKKILRQILAKLKKLC